MAAPHNSGILCSYILEILGLDCVVGCMLQCLKLLGVSRSSESARMRPELVIRCVCVNFVLVYVFLSVENRNRSGFLNKKIIYFIRCLNSFL